MSDLTLNEKLELIQQARDDIQDALEEKGQVVGKDIRDYAEAVTNITTSEDLTEELTAQTQKLEELEAILENKTQGEAKPNIYVQLTEPTSKNGIWLQTDKEVDEIIGDEDFFNDGEITTNKYGSPIRKRTNKYTGATMQGDNGIIYQFLYNEKILYSFNYKLNTLTSVLENLDCAFVSADAPLPTYVDGWIYFCDGDYSRTNTYMYKINIKTGERVNLTANGWSNMPHYTAVSEDKTKIYYFSGWSNASNVIREYDISQDKWRDFGYRSTTEGTVIDSCVDSGVLKILAMDGVLYLFNIANQSLTSTSMTNAYISSSYGTSGKIVGDYFYYCATVNNITKIYKYNMNNKTQDELRNCNQCI